MEISFKTIKIVVTSTLILFSILSLTFVYRNYQARKEISSLQNQIAQKDKTIEVQKGLYEKLAIETNDVKSLLNGKDEQIKSLKKELETKNQKLLSSTGLIIKWKKAYEAAISATQSEQPSETPNGIIRKKVEFKNDFGYIGVNGYTLTDPAYAWVRIQQNRPLRVNVAIAQGKDGQWTTYATSSEDNVAIDIGISGVNPWITKPKWYEKLGVMTNLAIGTTSGGSGLLSGLGVTYSSKSFEFGPAVWVGVSDRVDRYIGATLTWRPFAR